MPAELKSKKIIPIILAISSVSVIMLVVIISLFKFMLEDFFQHRSHSVPTVLQETEEAGQDAFGTIQEVMRRLYEDPKTDWKKVNLEALRKHLFEMEDMTMKVTVLEQTRLEDGIRVVILPTTERASESMRKILAAHPAQLKMEAGWDLAVEFHDDHTITLVATTSDRSQVDEMAGLGYIGLMAYGDHHRAHHWAISSGTDPHAHSQN